MSIEDYKYGKVSPVDNRDGEKDLTPEQIEKANSALRKNNTRKETNNSGVFTISPETEDVREFMRKNFEDSLSSTEKGLAIAIDLANELRSESENELKLSMYRLKINSIEESLKSLQELYKKDEFPEFYVRLTDALTMSDNLKLNYRFEDRRRA